MNEEVLNIWGKLSDIPVNNYGEIEEDFLHFPIGTEREEIWLWLEEEYNISVVELMYKGEK